MRNRAERWALLWVGCAAIGLGGCRFDTAGPGRLTGDAGRIDRGSVDWGFVFSDGGFVLRDMHVLGDSRADVSVSPDGGPLADGLVPRDASRDEGVVPPDTMPSCTGCPLGCNAAGDCYTSFDVSNVPISALEVGTAVAVLQHDAWVTLDTSALGFFTQDGQPIAVPDGVALLDSGNVVLMALGSLLVEPGATLRLAGEKPVVIAASGPIVVQGRIDASARGTRRGAGGGAGGAVGRAGQAGYNAAACAGGAAGSSFGMVSASGGGGGGLGGAGGEGGGGTAGGATCGDPWLRPLVGGPGGGGGARSGGAGGAGGGGVQLSSATAIYVDGLIKAGGGAGQGGSWGSGGGAGSGGGILLEAPVVDIAGALFAEGGGGGGGSNNAVSGDAGQDARDGGQRADGGSGGSALFDGGDGGKGSGEGVLSGADGTFETERGGGGGGGAGRIVLRSLATSTSGSVSPAPRQEAIVPQ